MEGNKKFNPYIVVIVVLALIIAALAYNQWGKDFFGSLKYKFAGSSKSEIKIGSDDAQVKIVEYYSYFCSYCKEFNDTVKPKIITNYVSNGKVQIIMRPFDLGEAVLCANEQGKFLEYHDYLFERSEALESENDLKNLAQVAGMDAEKFWQCYSSGKYGRRAESWYNQGVADFSRYKVPEAEKGTPAFIIGENMISGAQPYEVFAELIERELKQ